MKIIINEEFAKLAPKLADEEYRQLEENILKDGCREPLSLWKGILLDGHNRYKICQKHKIKFDTVDIKVDSRDDANIWIINNQLGRRNLTAFQRIELVAHLEPLYTKKAKENQLSTLKQGNKSPVLSTLVERKSINTQEVMSRLAGVSKGQYHKSKEILIKASDDEKEDLRNGKTTINRVHYGIQKEKARKAAAMRLKDAKLSYSSATKDEKINLICGDCVKKLSAISDDSVDLILTDPPFNVGLPYKTYKDSMIDDDYSEWCKAWLIECCRILKDNHYAIIFTGDIKLYYIHRAVMESGLTFHHFLKWYKLNGQCSLSGSVLFNRTELAFLCSKKEPNITLINRKKFYEDTITVPNTTPNQYDLGDHPATRPVELYRRIIEGFTKENDVVLDCFTGSGSSGCASKGTKRRYVGIEMDKYYFEMSKQRINATQEGSLLNNSIKCLLAVNAREEQPNRRGTAHREAHVRKINKRFVLN